MPLQCSNPSRSERTNWSFTQVMKGLTVGEYIITTPETEGLKDG